MIAAALLSVVFVTQVVPVHDRAFWVSVASNEFKVPAGSTAYDLLVEMNTLLGSPDPVLRDEVAYGAAARWIYRDRALTPAQVRQIRDLWLTNLRAGIGQVGDDSVLRRSFSALNLSIIAALESEAPFLSPQEFEDLLHRALEYLADERDTRGYEPSKGWMHSPAHTADLLKFLARNAKLQKSQQAVMLEALAAKCRSVGHVFVWGEDERLAQVVRSLVRREDFDLLALEALLADYKTREKQLWSAGTSIDPAAFAAVQNTKQMLRAAFVALSNDKEAPGKAVAAKDRIAGAFR